MTNRPTQVTTGEVRLSYEHLLKPYSNKPGTDPKYSVTMLIPKSDVATKQRIDAAINAAIGEGIAEKWNGARPPQPPTPVWDGDGLRQNGEAFGAECKGCWVLTAGSKMQPEIIDAGFNPIIQPTDVYSGMYARVFLKFFAYNSSGKKGIGCGLGPVQKLRDGEPLGGHVSAAEAFGVADTPPWQTAPAPMQGAYAPQPAPGVYAPQPAPMPGTYAPQPAPGAYAPQPPIRYDPITGEILS